MGFKNSRLFRNGFLQYSRNKVDMFFLKLGILKMQALISEI